MVEWEPRRKRSSKSKGKVESLPGLLVPDSLLNPVQRLSRKGLTLSIPAPSGNISGDRH